VVPGRPRAEEELRGDAIVREPYGTGQPPLP